VPQVYDPVVTFEVFKLEFMISKWFAFIIHFERIISNSPSLMSYQSVLEDLIIICRHHEVPTRYPFPVNSTTKPKIAGIESAKPQ
jgi:hypothetical protein